MKFKHKCGQYCKCQCGSLQYYHEPTDSHACTVLEHKKCSHLFESRFRNRFLFCKLCGYSKCLN